MYFCAEIVSGECLTWVEFSLLPSLSMQDATILGFSFLALSATAWGIGLVASFLIKSR